MLALPGCGCQHLSPHDACLRLLAPGCGPLAEVSARYSEETGFWVAVAKGADVRVLGAVADVALGLGADVGEAVARASGEVLERYGAALVPPDSPTRIPLARWDGSPCGDGPAADAWLPYHRHGMPVLPVRSSGLAFDFRRTDALRAASCEKMERQAIDALLHNGLGFARPLGSIPLGRLAVRAFTLPAPVPVALALLAGPSGAIMAAGAAAAANEADALAEAGREVAIDWLLAAGAVLPGSGVIPAALLGPLAGTRLPEWPRSTGADARSKPINAARVIRNSFGFADLTPADIAIAGGFVTRAMATMADPCLMRW
ncbi:MAG: hypothetical protein FWD73_16955 [Polyangiaceae bacterium]|nr:hypothetical protein [Polyangiaceae bacterium]